MSRFAPRSVRARTTLVATLLVTLALMGGAFLLVRALEHSLSTATDEQARSRVTDLLDQARAGTLAQTVDGIGDDSLAQVVVLNPEGEQPIAWSANIAERPPVRRVEDVGSALSVRTMRGLPDDDELEDYRIWSARGRLADGRIVAAFVGPSLESTQQATARLAGTLALGLPVLLLVLASGIWVTVGRALRPVENVRREVAELGARSLHRRVPVPQTRDELQRLATTMNEMLDRLESADRRQREFIGNASHDLQSPLTVLRTEIEVALTRGEHTDWQPVAHLLLSETDRMEALVADLLFLARTEEPDPAAYRPLDLEDLVAEEVARFPSTATPEIRLSASPAPTSGNRSELSRMVRNLLHNATEFAHTRVDVEVGEQGGEIVLTVLDDGPGVAQEHREAVFERFVTLDRSRDRRGGGTGLGLAIARSVALAHDGTLALEGPAPAARFVVRLPRL